MAAVFCLICSAGALIGLLEAVVARGGLLCSVLQMTIFCLESEVFFFWRGSESGVWEASATTYPKSGRTAMPISIVSRTTFCRLLTADAAFIQFWVRARAEP